jgi:hypothetical protein
VELRTVFTTSQSKTIYIVEDDFGPKVGRAFRETDPVYADRETTLDDLASYQYNDPVRVVAFNTSEGWSRDVSHEFAVEIQRRADLEDRELVGTLAEFVEFYTKPARQLSLRLA